MLIQQIAPVAATEFAPVFVALELSRSKWLVGVGTPQKWAVRRHQVDGGDLDGLLALLSRVAAGEEKRSGLPAKVHVCFEAGRDGHWLYRALKSAGYDAYEIRPGRPRFRPNGAGSPGAPVGVADPAEVEGRARPRMPPLGRDRRRHRRD